MLLNLIDKTRNNKDFARTIGGRRDQRPGRRITGSFQVENVGPASATVIVSATAPLSHTTRITMLGESNRIDINNEITQNFTNIVTWGFGFNLNSPDMWHEETGAVDWAKSAGRWRSLYTKPPRGTIG